MAKKKDSTSTEKAPITRLDPSETIASLRFLARVAGVADGVAFTCEESFGLDVILSMLADKLEGGAA